MLLNAINRILEEHNIPKEEFNKDPYDFIDKLKDGELKWLLQMAMELMD